jgi:hypothetical protein
LPKPFFFISDHLGIIFNDPFRIGLTQIPPHAFGVLGLFSLLTIESKLSAFAMKKAPPLHGRAL